MKVLLLGATGNLGSRILPALLTHGHTVVAYVRSAQKLQSLLPESVFRQITTIKGDATDVNAIKTAILDSKCDAIVTAAGVAAMAPWAKSDLPKIFQAILQAVRQAGEERGQPLRFWCLGGTGVLYYPGTQSMLSSYIPVFLEHRQNVALLRELPPNSVDWSMLCPGNMTPESSDFNVPTKTSQGKLIAQAANPPSWQHLWVRFIPVIGKSIEMAINFSRYDTKLEQNAELIAADLEEGHDSRFVGTTVGIISGSK
ncbi:hypothetical protein M409DRAFT_66107 [Zasmidium cellare ATCC 36951]|uniref:NAD(P)-binding domain-containing protein n=1 Tax=Zasmidium cellare ATCC 36951 TaxID=1080233 RepID=A0A6A6CM40_ZASCE|nr:uncharacterized protein M409DRAFT_66107 [Zasmidium cellare ATCC 36951]KAF2166992.1 hypothetical protein M409DRAFT_66107 [Zasmidium cellare ATCC 36951]